MSIGVFRHSTAALNMAQSGHGTRLPAIVILFPQVGRSRRRHHR
jgi:hypothetical protein